MTLKIDREERDCLHALMAYRFFIGDDLRLERARAQSVTQLQLAREFYEDMQLMADLGWLHQELMEALRVAEASWGRVRVDLPAADLRAALQHPQVFHTDEAGPLFRSPRVLRDERRDLV